MSFLEYNLDFIEATAIPGSGLKNIAYLFWRAG